ncbi:MAG: hypothetical protein HY787_28670 [Deltaproteobacteria bacterium]|nr:hypothetical protein [Deltaproteobacteria bacterium]
MNGKDYIVEAKEKTERLLAVLKAVEGLRTDPVIKTVAKACETLEYVKNKATLKTRPGTNLAFPVYDASNKLEEIWEESGPTGDPRELKEQIEEFVTSVETLNAALKERTVIMT